MERIVRRAFPELGVVDGAPGLYRPGVTLERSADVEDLYRLLKSSITIDDGLEESHALDFHQHADENDELIRTEIGEACYRAKYEHSVADAELLIERFAEFVSRHPTYARASFVASVASWDGAQRNLSWRLADGLARRLATRHIALDRPVAREQQKNVTHDDPTVADALRRRNQLGSMTCSTVLHGDAIIVIDDLYGSGATLAEASRVLKGAGAGEVYGLTATKQLRFTTRR